MAMTVRSADACRRLAQEAGVGDAEVGQYGGNVVVVCVEREDLLCLRAALVLDDGLKQLLLALEIDVERALRHAGLARDRVHAGGVEALGQE